MILLLISILIALLFTQGLFFTCRQMYNDKSEYEKKFMLFKYLPAVL